MICLKSFWNMVRFFTLQYIFNNFDQNIKIIKMKLNMKRILYFALPIMFFASCEPRQGQTAEEIQAPTATTTLHEFVVEEVLQATSYTYVKAKEGSNSIWMAIPKREVEVGKTYYYDNPMEMKNFNSKDLDRTFESIYFLSGISESPDAKTPMKAMSPDDENHKKQSPVQEKELNIEKEEGIVSIGYLFDNKSDYENKKIKVKGIVTKFNADIMARNWVHIQDGTGGETSFDLTITTLDVVEVGDIAIFEGVVAIDKDFGAGYKYDLIIEEAVQTNKKSDMKVN